MNEEPSSQLRSKRWKWVLGIAAIVIFSAVLAGLLILWSFDFNRLKPLLAQVVKQETGRNLEILGAIDLKLGLRPSLVAEDIRFQNAPWSASPEMVTIKRLEAKILALPLLKKEIHITRLVLVEPEVLLEKDTSGRWNFEFEKPETMPQKDAPPQTFALPGMAFHQVQIDKGSVSYRDGGTGVFCCVAIERFTVHSEGGDSPIVLALKGSYKEKALELRGTIGSLLLLKNPDKDYPVDLTATAAGAQLRVEGKIKDILNSKGLNLAAEAAIPSTSQMAAFFGETLPAELGPLQVRVVISDAGERSYRLSDLNIKSRAGDAGGTLTVGVDSSRPKVSGSLRSQHLNLSPFLNGEKSRQAKPDPGAKKNRVFPNDPLPLDVLKHIDLQLKLDADRVELPQLSLANLSMEVSLNNGRLVLNPIRLKAAEGDADAQVEVHAQGNVATAKAIFKVRQMDLRKLSKELKVDGRADVDVDLLGRGSTVAGLMAGLNGRTVVVMGQGRVDNKTVQVLGGDLASGVFQLFNPSSQAASHTEINCGVAGFDVRDGMAKVTALVVDTPDMSVIGDGEINLRDETLDLALNPHAKGGANGLSLSLGELAKSFKLGGTLANPSLQIDAAQTMLTAGKAAGGVLLFGPVGLAAALAGQPSGDANPCLTALESAKKGVSTSESGKRGEQKGTEEKGLAGTLRSVEESVKKLFNGQGAKPPSEKRSGAFGGGGP